MSGYTCTLRFYMLQTVDPVESDLYLWYVLRVLLDWVTISSDWPETSIYAELLNVPFSSHCHYSNRILWVWVGFSLKDCGDCVGLGVKSCRLIIAISHVLWIVYNHHRCFERHCCNKFWLKEGEIEGWYFKCRFYEDDAFDALQYLALFWAR